MGDFVIFMSQMQGRGTSTGRLLLEVVAEAASPPVPAPDEYPIQMEVRRADGQVMHNRLATGTTYSVHFDAGGRKANYYAAFAVATDRVEGFANATAPGQGEWQSTGWFEFVDNELDFGQTFAAPGYPAPYLRTQYVSDELPNGQAASDGHLFDFTTGIAGEVSVDLYMY